LELFQDNFQNFETLQNVSELQQVLNILNKFPTKNGNFQTLEKLSKVFVFFGKNSGQFSIFFVEYLNMPFL